MAKVKMNLAALCEALGVERPNEVRRVVLDIRWDYGAPILLIERYADTEKIMAALTGPNIELRRDDPGAATPAPKQAKVERIDGAPTFNGPIRGAKIAWGNGDVTQNG